MHARATHYIHVIFEMSLTLNPSTAVQSGLTLIAALTCVDFLRDLPSLSHSADKNELLMVKFLLSIIIVMTVLIIMFTFSPASPVAPSNVPA